MELTDVITLIERVWRRWAKVGATVIGERWRRPTRLDGWDVAALYAHAAMWPVAFTEVAKVQVEGTARYRTGAQLLAAMNAPDGLAHTAAPQVARMARDSAAATSPTDLVARFTDAAPTAIAALRGMPDGAVVEHAGGARVPLVAPCELALVEATVHLLDLRAALKVGQAAPDLPDTLDVPIDAVAATRDVLAAIPDPVRFIEAATGRTTEPVLPVLR